MRICVVTPRFAVSGVPLAQLRLAEALAANGHAVDFVIGCINQGFSMPQMHGVRVMILDRATVRGMLYPLWTYFRKHKPDVVFSAEDHLNTIVLIAAIFSRSPAKISASSRVTPYDTYSTNILTKRWVLKQVFRAVMRRADVLTCVSKDMVEQYRKVFRNAPHVCVYNIVDNQVSRKKMLEPVDAEWFMEREIPLIVAAGQLEPWKGFADLIHAVKEVSRSRNVRWVIFGEGSLRGQLERLIEEFGLADNVKLPGNVANPLKYFTQAQVFALTSYVEGMPNALVEAMMCGCTPVATDCPTGPRELLDEGKFGYLVSVGDPTSIACGIEKALDKPIAKCLLAEAIAPFEEQTVLARHFELLGLPNDGIKLSHLLGQKVT